MSYDYILVRGEPTMDVSELFADMPEGEMPPEELAQIQGAASVFGASMSQAIGPVEEVQSSIAEVFPDIKWQKQHPTPEMNLPETHINGPAYFGLGGPEFQLSCDTECQVRMITMSYAEREQVELLAQRMSLRVLDEQSLETFGS